MNSLLVSVESVHTMGAPWVLIFIVISTLSQQAVWGVKNVTLQADSLLVENGKDVTLRCKYETKAKVYSVKWHKDGELFIWYLPKKEPPELLSLLPIEVDLHNHTTVTLKNVTSTSAGKYTCEVYIVMPCYVLESDVVEIAVKDSKVNKNIKMYSEPPVLRIRDNVTLRCNYSLPPESEYSVKWYKDNEEFYRFTSSEQPNKKVFPLPSVNIDLDLSNNHEIVLPDVKIETSGNYTCKVLIDEPFSLELQAAKYLSVQAAKKKGNFMVNIEPPEPKLGERIWLKCHYDFNNEAAYIVKWYKDSNQIYQFVSGSKPLKAKNIVKYSNINLESSNDQQVLLEDITAEASGTYTCEVVTLSAKEKASKNVIVKTEDS